MADSTKERTLVILVISLVIIVVLATFLNKIKNSNDLVVPNEDIDAPTATLEDPITLSNNEIIIKGGNTQMIKIGIYNPTEEIMENITPIITCNDPTITTETNPITIQPKENTQTTMLIKTTKKTIQEIHVCTITAITKNIDLIIRVI